MNLRCPHCGKGIIVRSRSKAKGSRTVQRAVQEDLVLRAVRQASRGSSDGWVGIDRVWNKYSQLKPTRPFKLVGQRQVLNVLDTLEEQGALVRMVTSTGRHGRRSHVKLSRK